MSSSSVPPPPRLLGLPGVRRPPPPLAEAPRPADPFMDLMDSGFNAAAANPRPPMGLTENSSATYLSTGNPCLDFFFQVVPDTPAATVTALLAAAWEHDPLTALKLACHLRGVRGTGKSDKEGFYASALWLHAHHPKTLALNVGSFAEFGYMKDLLEMAALRRARSLVPRLLLPSFSAASADRRLACVAAPALARSLPAPFVPRPIPVGLAGAVSFSLTLVTAAVEAKEPPAADLLPKDVVLYQYEACPFCNKVKGMHLTSDGPTKKKEREKEKKKAINMSGRRRKRGRGRRRRAHTDGCNVLHILIF